MRVFSKVALVAAVVCSLYCSSISAQAASSDLAHTPMVTESGMVMKLGRGIANVAFGPLELLIRPWDVARQQGEIAALTFGVLQGVVYTVAREVVGVVDIVTFPIPLPGATDDPNLEGYGYGPLMRPAWVVDIDHNAYGFFYRDDAMLTNN